MSHDLMFALTLLLQIQAAPPARAHHALIYDPRTSRVLLTGGSSPSHAESSGFFGDTWTFDGRTWRTTSVTARPMSGVTLAYDVPRRRIVSFGGYDGRSLGEFRVLDEREWRLVENRPELAGAEAGFVYDAKGDRFVSFGGSTAPGQVNVGTRVLKNGVWTTLSGPQPPPRQAHVMVYDERTGRVLLFGGMGAGSPGQRPPLLEDTWLLDGDTWTQLHIDGPGPRGAAGAAYDSCRGRVIVFGGMTPNGFAGDTWAFDGRRWVKLATDGPEARAMGYLAYDKRRDRVVLFGGRKGWPNGDLNDTWQFDGTAWRQVP
jgi:hypothetical protein